MSQLFDSASQPSGPIWSEPHVVEMCAAVVHGLILKDAADLAQSRVIGGSRFVTTTSAGVVVKTVSVRLGAERYFHIITLRGALDAADALMSADIMGRLLNVPVTVEAKRGTTCALMRLQRDAEGELELQQRLAALQTPRALAAALTRIATVH